MHPPETQYRFGNAHGRYSDCLMCGSSWKATVHKNPITKEPVDLWNFRGVREKPRGKLMKAVGDSSGDEDWTTC